MDDAEKLSLEAIGRFVAASEEIRFEAKDREQLYGWVEQVLAGRQYGQLGKAARGLVRRYIEKMTGLSRAQVTRLIALYTVGGKVQVTVYRRRRFAELYTRADIELLASVDEAHETLSGPATRRILEREHLLYKRPEYARLATISVAHLYNLRKHARYRERLLEHMLRQFPFRILGFHSDNGSEFINKTVAQLLEKLRVEQTKSRPRQSGDNGLVETKNGAVIRKHIGYGYIDASHADRINDFYQEYLNPYLNYHRPCAQPDVKIDEKGRKRVTYKRYQTPLETLSLLDKPAQYLRDGLSMNALKRVAAAISDTDAARRMQQAKARLFERLRLTA